jgi:hypothetical protein
MMICALLKIYNNKIACKAKSESNQLCKTLSLKSDFKAWDDEETAFAIKNCMAFCEFVLRAFEFLGFKDEGINNQELFERTEANQKWQARIK